jgi:hypothetical protein
VVCEKSTNKIKQLLAPSKRTFCWHEAGRKFIFRRKNKYHSDKLVVRKHNSLPRRKLSVLLLMTVFTQALFALVCCNFVTFTFFSARHTALNLYVNVICTSIQTACDWITDQFDNFFYLQRVANSAIFDWLPTPSYALAKRQGVFGLLLSNDHDFSRRSTAFCH